MSTIDETNKIIESAKKNEGLAEDAAYAIAELMAGNLTYKNSGFTNIRTKRGGSKDVYVEYNGKKVTVSVFIGHM